MSRNRRRTAAALGALILGMSASGCATWHSELISGAGGTAGNGQSYNAVTSPDGTKVAFITQANNLGPTDSNGQDDVYVRDLSDGTVTNLNENAAGTDSGDKGSGGPTDWVSVFDATGTKAVFASDASNLGPPDTNRRPDVYVRDLVTGSATLVSANATGTNGGNGSSNQPTISRDGRKVVFESAATDLGPADSNGLVDLYVRDLSIGTTALVSANAAGTSGGNAGPDEPPVISPDGTKVAFLTRASNLGAPDLNADTDLYVRDLTTGTTTLVSAGADGTAAGAALVRPVFSPDSRKLAFASQSGDFGHPEANGIQGVYVRDLDSGRVDLVSANADGSVGPAAHPVYSPDGTTIAFQSTASAFGPTDTNGQNDVYLRDLTNHTTTLVSVNAAGTDSGNGWAGFPSGDVSFSPDGSKVAFPTTSSDLGPTDTNVRADIYIRDLVAKTTTLVTVRADRADTPNNGSIDPKFALGGTGVIFMSLASDFGSTDANGTWDVYLAILRE